MGPIQDRKLEGPIPLNLSLDTNSLWFNALSSGPTGVAALGVGSSFSAQEVTPPVGTHDVALTFGMEKAVAQCPELLASEP